MSNRRNLNELRRRRPTLEPLERLLLVCEGEKTEVIYFSLFLTRLRAANIDMKIAKRECGSDPLSIVQFAKGLMRDDPGIDRCYCVIDRDTHATFDAAVQEALDYNQTLAESGREFVTVRSYPCFEIWFIYHFIMSRAPFDASRGKSAGDLAVSALKRHLPEYSKNAVKVIAQLLERTGEAITNAERAHYEAIQTNQPNPSTEVYILVRKLNKYGN